MPSSGAITCPGSRKRVFAPTFSRIAWIDWVVVLVLAGTAGSPGCATGPMNAANAWTCSSASDSGPAAWRPTSAASATASLLLAKRAALVVGRVLDPAQPKFVDRQRRLHEYVLVVGQGEAGDVIVVVVGDHQQVELAALVGEIGDDIRLDAAHRVARALDLRQGVRADRRDDRFGEPG